MKVRVLVCLLIISILRATNLCAEQTQSNTADARAIAMLKEFYTAYITASSALPAKASLERLVALPKKYCTSSLLRKKDAEYKSGHIEADPFLLAQDSDILCLKTLRISKDAKALNSYTVSYQWPYTADKIIIHLAVIKQGEKFKISAIR